MNSNHPRLALGLLAACLVGPALTACDEASSSADPDGPSLEITVAPLTLTGISDASYRVSVHNADNALVWELSGLSSQTYGDGRGSLTYVGTCDASRSPNRVTLTIESLSDAGGPLGADEWVDPGPISRTAECLPNRDTFVSFDVTLMRRAEQGFFDIAVNFDDIFCSAKVDCTYDDAGLQPIELLFDPQTGERGQTINVAFACTAGPGEDDATRLLMNDLRLVCGGDSSPLSEVFAGYGVSACEPDGSVIYGIRQVVSSDGIAFEGLQWTRDGNGYAVAPVQVADLDTHEVTPGVPFTDAVLLSVVDEHTALGLVIATHPMTDPGDPFSSLSGIVATVFERDPSAPTNPDAWRAAQILGLPAGLPLPLMVPQGSQDVARFIVARPSLDGGSEDDSPFFLYPRDPGSTAVRYLSPIALTRGPEHTGCGQVFISEDAIAAPCTNTTSQSTDILVWPIADLSNDIAARTLTVPLSELRFTDDATPGWESTPTAVTGVQDVGLAGDWLFAGLVMDVPGAPEPMVRFAAFRQTTPGDPATYALTEFPGAAIPTRIQSQSHLAFAGGAPGHEVVIGGGSNTFFAHLTADTWAMRTDFTVSTGATENGTEVLAPVQLFAVLFEHDGLGALAIGHGRTPSNDEVFFVTTSTEEVVTPLPFPRGYRFDAPLGTLERGAETTVSARIVEEATQRLFHLEWRFTIDAAGIVFAGWDVFGATFPAVDGGDLQLQDRERSGQDMDPRFDTSSMRCRQTVLDFEPTDGDWFDRRVVVVDPTLDASDVLVANDDSTGRRFVADAIDAPELPAATPNGDGAGSVTLISPAPATEGNHWTSQNPKPDSVPSFVWQAATYWGQEALTCNGQPCNKLFWTTAIGISPSQAIDCELRFEATAASVSHLVDGQVPVDTVWPWLVARVPITGDGSNPDDNLLCRRHPMLSEHFDVIYTSGDTAQPARYGYGPNGSPTTLP